MIIHLEISNLDLFCHITLVVYLVIFITLHAGRIRSLASIMADTANPRTPTKKLFKASSKTKTPTPRRPRSNSSLSAQSISRHSTASPELTKVASNATQSAQKAARPAGSLPKEALDEVTQSTTLAPLAGASDAAPNVTDETPTGLVDTDTISQSTDPAHTLSTAASDKLKRTTSSASNTANKPTEAVGESESQASTPRSTWGKRANSTDSVPEEAAQTLRRSISGLSEMTSNPDSSGALNSPIDIAKYFSDNGNIEMSHFITALTNKGPAAAHASDDFANDNKSSGATSREDVGAHDTVVDKDVAATASGAAGKLPTDDDSVGKGISGSAATKDPTSDASKPGALNKSNQPDDSGSPAPQTLSAAKGVPQVSAVADKTPNVPQPADVSKETEGASDIERKATGAVSNITSSNQQIPDAPMATDQAKAATSDADRKVKDGPSSGAEDGTQEFDNMGRPAHIERRIDIPLPRPEKVVNSPPLPTKPELGNLANELGDPNHLPTTDHLYSTDNLRSTHDLQDIPEDPPEELLDPSVHSASANVSPIPKISKIAPIGVAPPLDLAQLAKGLGGHVVDDVGSVVDESGKVLGHVTGDLPAMVGKKVADNGEVYGDGGELIGYVNENFVNPPPPTDIPSDVMGGLKVDHNGNILDASGNIIGRFHNKPGPNGELGPFANTSQQNQEQGSKADDKPKQEDKPKVNAHTGGSPSDIFLDVKSTQDGIQLTIRIPTTFQKSPPGS